MLRVWSVAIASSIPLFAAVVDPQQQTEPATIVQLEFVEEIRTRQAARLDVGLEIVLVSRNKPADIQAPGKLVPSPKNAQHSKAPLKLGKRHGVFIHRKLLSIPVFRGLRRSARHGHAPANSMRC